MVTPSPLRLLEKADILRSEGRLADATRLYRAILGQPGPHGRALAGLASVLEAQGRFDASLACVERALPSAPRDPGLLLQRARLLQFVGRHDEALAAYEAAAAARAGFAAPLVGQAYLLMGLGRCDEAREAIERALAAKPESAAAKYLKAELLLMFGDAAGWEFFESRLAMRIAAHDHRTDALARWDGQPLDGTLLVQGEIGLGDFLMFARYLPAARARVRNLVMAVDSSLVRLCAVSFPDSTVIPVKGTLPPSERFCRVMSLPHLLRDGVRSIPSAIPYLKVPPAVTRKWQDILGPQMRPRVGLVWAGRDREIDLEPMRRRRVAPSALRGLLKLPFEFHSLHNEPPADSGLLPATDHSRDIEDLADTGALATLMDLVISIDTSVAHLAGGLGVPLWVLLPFASDYRWEHGAGTRWYPHARLFRQQVPGGWDEPMEEIATALARHFRLPQP